MGSSIKTKYLFLLYMVILIPITLLGSLSYHLNRVRLVDARLENKRRILLSFRDIVVFSHMEDMERNLETLADNPQLYRITSDIKVQNEILEQWNWLHQFFPKKAWIYFGDLDNRIAIFPQWYPDDAFDLRERPWFLNALNSPNNAVWSPPFNDYVTSKVVLTISKSIRNPEGDVVGVLAIDTFLEDFLTLFQSGMEKQEKILLLIDENHQVLASNYPEFLESSQSFPENIKGRLPKVYYNEQVFYVSEVDIEALNWRLISLLPSEEIFQDMSAVRFTFIIILGLSLLLGGMVSYFMSSYIIRNIDALNRYMGQIMEGDYRIRTCVDSDDEFSRMNQRLNQMTQKLSQSITTVKTLMQLLSHSVSNSLTAMDQRLIMLMKQPSLDESCLKELEGIEKDLHSTQLFILNTTLGKTQRLDQLYKVSDRTNAGELLETLRERMRRRAARKEQQILVMNHHRALFLRGNSFLLLHCLENVVDNAIKYSPYRSDVEIWTQLSGEAMNIFVADHGPGVNHDEIGLLFMEGQQLSAKPSGGEQSHGIGLAVSLKMLQGLGGSMEYHDKEGYGAIFSIKLPIYHEDNPN